MLYSASSLSVCRPASLGSPPSLESLFQLRRQKITSLVWFSWMTGQQEMYRDGKWCPWGRSMAKILWVNTSSCHTQMWLIFIIWLVLRNWSFDERVTYLMISWPQKIWPPPGLAPISSPSSLLQPKPKWTGLCMWRASKFVRASNDLLESCAWQPFHSPEYLL